MAQARAVAGSGGKLSLQQMLDDLHADGKLSEDNRIDREILLDHLDLQILETEVLERPKTNPLDYNLYQLTHARISVAGIRCR